MGLSHESVEADVLYWRVLGREEENLFLSQISGTFYYLWKTNQKIGLWKLKFRTEILFVYKHLKMFIQNMLIGEVRLVALNKLTTK